MFMIKMNPVFVLLYLENNNVSDKFILGFKLYDALLF